MNRHGTLALPRRLVRRREEFGACKDVHIFAGFGFFSMAHQWYARSLWAPKGGLVCSNSQVGRTPQGGSETRTRAVRPLSEEAPANGQSFAGAAHASAGSDRRKAVGLLTSGVSLLETAASNGTAIDWVPRGRPKRLTAHGRLNVQSGLRNLGMVDASAPAALASVATFRSEEEIGGDAARRRAKMQSILLSFR